MATKMITLGGMTVTEDEARKAGLLPEQRRARHASQLATLQKLGLGGTREAQALALAVAHLAK